MNENHKTPEAHEIHEAQLTAYALGQLNAKEREAAEAVLARSDKARQFVEETKSLAAHIKEAYQQSPAPQASPSLRNVIEKQLQALAKPEPATPSTLSSRQHSWLRRHWKGCAIGGTCACLLLALLIPAHIAERSIAKPSSVARTMRDDVIFFQNKAGANSSPQSRIKSIKVQDQDDSWAEEQNTLDDPTELKGDAYRVPMESRKPPELPRDIALHSRVGGDGRSGMRGVEESMGYQHPFATGSHPVNAGDYAQKRAKIMQDDSVILGHQFTRDSEIAEGPSPSAPGTEQYAQTIENHFRSVARHPLSTFSIDVDTASYANVRRFLMTEGRLPPPDAVRIEEMINYFTYHYSPPSGHTPFSVQMEAAACPWQPEHRLVRIGLKGREIDRRERGPSNIVFLLDVSGSMNDPYKLPLVKQAMRMLVDQLQENDHVAIVTYANGTAVPLPSARGSERNRIMAAIEALQANGSTYGSAGIELAYQQAQENFVEGGINRILLCTDGDLNVGITNDDDLTRLIKQKAKSGVFLTVLGFGTGNLKDGKLEKLADNGNGIYAYIDGLREARRVLVEQMTGSLVTIAKDVKIQVEFNPAEVAAYRLVGYENRVMANRDFDNDRKDAGDIGAGHTVTALYELVPAHGNHPATGANRPLKYQRVPQEDLSEQAQSGELLTLRLRYKEPDQDKSSLLEFPITDAGIGFGRASDDFRFASAVAAFGMILRNSPQCGQATLAAVEEYAAGALDKDPNGQRAEFLDLVRRAKTLAPGR